MGVVRNSPELPDNTVELRVASRLQSAGLRQAYMVLVAYGIVAGR